MIVKRKWLLWVISLFMLFMYSMGIYDFFMMLSHNTSYYASHGYGEIVVKYFTDYPIYFMIFWIVNLVCGFSAPVLLLLGKRTSKIVALISTIADLILIISTSIFRNRFEVLGINVFIFDIFILLITICFYFYCRHIYKERINS